MKHVLSCRSWMLIALVVTVAAGCSASSGDPTPPDVATVTATGTATTSPTATVPPTSTTFPTPSSVPATPTVRPTPEPYPGQTLPFPVSDCAVTPMTGWRYLADYLGAWLGGAGLEVGVRDGLLYEGDNQLLWFAHGSGDVSVTLTPLDGSLEPVNVTAPESTAADGTPVWETTLTFPSHGCWRMTGEQGDNQLEATVQVYPVVCRPAEYDPANCAEPPFAVYWDSERVTPPNCDVNAVIGIVTGFLGAFNHGNLAATVAYFPDRDQEHDLDTTGLRWFSITTDVANRPDELPDVLATLQASGERLRLVRLDIVWGWTGGATIGMRMTRENDELPRHWMDGKAGINCELGQFWSMSAGPAPEPIE